MPGASTGRRTMSRIRDAGLSALAAACMLAAGTAPAQTGAAPEQRFAGEMVAQVGHTQEIHNIVYARDGGLIATSARDGKVKLWTPDGRLLRTIETPGPLPGVALSADGSMEIGRAHV